jgi:hypothetical protein
MSISRAKRLNVVHKMSVDNICKFVDVQFVVLQTFTMVLDCNYEIMMINSKYDYKC